MKKQILMLALIISATLCTAQTSYTFNPNTNHTVTLTEAAVMTKNYRDASPSSAEISNAFGKTDIISLLNQTGCVGIRFYYAINSSGNSVLVAVGVDSSSNDLTSGIVLDRSMCCHCVGVKCANSNALNTN